MSTDYIDFEALEAQTQGDRALTCELLGMLIDHAPTLMASIEATSGVARADVAHRLKGSALALAAMPLAEASGALEQEPDNSEALMRVRLLVRDTLASARRLLSNYA